MGTEQVIDRAHLLVDTPPEVRRIGDRARTGDRAEVGVPQLEHDRAADPPAGPQPHGDGIRLPEQLAPQQFGVADVDLERHLMADALLLHARRHPARIDAVREFVQLVRRRITDHPLQRGHGCPRDVADGAEPPLGQGLLCRRTDPPEERDGKRMKKRERLPGRDHEHSIGFRTAGRELGDELHRSRADRAVQPGLGEHARADELTDLRGRAEQRPRARDVEECLVDAHAFDDRGDVVEDGHDLLRVEGVLLAVRLEHDRVRAQPQRLGERDGRAYPELAGRIICRGDDRASGVAGDDHGPVHEIGPVEEFDRGEERVEVDVEDGRGGAVHRGGADLPVAAVLPAHLPITP